MALHNDPLSSGCTILVLFESLVFLPYAYCKSLPNSCKPQVMFNAAMVPFWGVFFLRFFIIIYVYICISVCIYACEYPQRLEEEGVGSPGVGVIGGYELPIVGVGNYNWSSGKYLNC